MLNTIQDYVVKYANVIAKVTKIDVEMDVNKWGIIVFNSTGGVTYLGKLARENLGPLPERIGFLCSRMENLFSF